MLLPDLPNELLCQICEVLDTVQDITSFSQLNHHLHRLTEDHLYRFDVQEGKSSALLWAATHGRLQTAKKALKALQKSEQPTVGSEADANTTNEPATNPVGIALINAAEKGHTSLVRLLIEHGAQLKWRDPERRQSAMEAACTKGHISIVKLLLKSGVRPFLGALHTALSNTMRRDDGPHRHCGIAHRRWCERGHLHWQAGRRLLSPFAACRKGRS
jgi:ankyrin repeat protein